MTVHKCDLQVLRSKLWPVFVIALISFATGSLMTTRLTEVRTVSAESNRLFELRVYHAMPGKLPIMESRFRDTTSKLLAKHGLNVVGYWSAEGASASENAFVFLLAHQSREEAKQNWDAMSKDPEFRPVIKAEQTEKTLEKADVIYMRPTNFSPMK
jgi:hypothetical protein